MQNVIQCILLSLHKVIGIIRDDQGLPGSDRILFCQMVDALHFCNIFVLILIFFIIDIIVGQIPQSLTVSNRHLGIILKLQLILPGTCQGTDSVIGHCTENDHTDRSKHCEDLTLHLLSPLHLSLIYSQFSVCHSIYTLLCSHNVFHLV